MKREKDGKKKKKKRENMNMKEPMGDRLIVADGGNSRINAFLHGEKRKRLK